MEKSDALNISVLIKEKEPERVSQDERQGSQHEQAVETKQVVTHLIGWILQGGVMLSAAIIALGLLLLPTRPGGLSPQRLLNFPQTLAQVGEGLLILRPQAIIALGLILLVATPVPFRYRFFERTHF